MKQLFIIGLIVLMSFVSQFAPARANSAPLIAVSGSSSDSKSVAAMMASLRAQGASPIFIGDHEHYVAQHGGVKAAVAGDLARYDGVVVMGNNADIDPAKYGQAPHKETHIETNQARADYEDWLIVSALEKNVPLYTICGGMQRLNVLGGGTLMQHVPDRVGDNHHMQADADIPPFVPVQAVKLLEGTKLSEMGRDVQAVYTPSHEPLPPGAVMENSFHHQAVDKVADGFRAAAISEDGIIEAIEPEPGSKYADQTVIAVQWHPEFGASQLSPRLNQYFIEAAREHRQSRQASPQQDEAIAPQAAMQENTWQHYVKQRRSGPLPGYMPPLLNL